MDQQEVFINSTEDYKAELVYHRKLDNEPSWSTDEIAEVIWALSRIVCVQEKLVRKYIGQ